MLHMEVCSHTFVAHGSVPQLFLVVWIFLMSLGVFCYYRWGLSEDYKNYSKMGASWNYSLPFWFWPLFNFAILPKVCKPGKFESCNSFKLSFTNIWGLLSIFIKCESFLKSNSPDLALCETNLNDSTDSDNFSVKGLYFFNWKGFCYSSGFISSHFCYWITVLKTKSWIEIITESCATKIFES